MVDHGIRRPAEARHPEGNDPKACCKETEPTNRLTETEPEPSDAPQIGIEEQPSEHQVDDTPPQPTPISRASRELNNLKSNLGPAWQIDDGHPTTNGRRLRSRTTNI